MGLTAFMLIGPLFYRYAGAPMVALMTCVLAGTGLALAGLGALLSGPSNSVTAVCSASPTV